MEESIGPSQVTLLSGLTRYQFNVLICPDEHEHWIPTKRHEASAVTQNQSYTLLFEEKTTEKTETLVKMHFHLSKSRLKLHLIKLNYCEDENRTWMRSHLYDIFSAH